VSLKGLLAPQSKKDNQLFNLRRSTFPILVVCITAGIFACGKKIADPFSFRIRCRQLCWIRRLSRPGSTEPGLLRDTLLS
jgi:hypothetical protein